MQQATHCFDLCAEIYEAPSGLLSSAIQKCFQIFCIGGFAQTFAFYCIPSADLPLMHSRLFLIEIYYDLLQLLSPISNIHDVSRFRISS